MNYSNKRNRKRPMAEINVVPYIDVMLVLLVIFMITAPLLSQGVKVQLPQASAQTLDSKQPEPLIVSVDASGLYYLNASEHPNTPINAADLLTRIAAELQIAQQKNQHRDVLVKGDKDVAYGKVVTAMVLLQEAGVPSVGLMTQTPETVYSKSHT